MNSSEDSENIDRMPHLMQMVLSSDDAASTSALDVVQFTTSSVVIFIIWSFWFSDLIFFCQ